MASAMAMLRAMFGNKIPDPEASVLSRWEMNPASRGAYDCFPVGSDGDAFDALEEPCGDRLFFAGDSTIRKAPGTVHGAYLSGVREAKRIAGLKGGKAPPFGPEGGVPSGGASAPPHGKAFPRTGAGEGCGSCHSRPL